MFKSVNYISWTLDCLKLNSPEAIATLSVCFNCTKTGLHWQSLSNKNSMICISVLPVLHYSNATIGTSMDISFSLNQEVKPEKHYSIRSIPTRRLSYCLFLTLNSALSLTLLQSNQSERPNNEKSSMPENTQTERLYPENCRKVSVNFARIPGTSQTCNTVLLPSPHLHAPPPPCHFKLKWPFKNFLWLHLL